MATSTATALATPHPRLALLIPSGAPRRCTTPSAGPAAAPVLRAACAATPLHSIPCHGRGPPGR
eukprot:13156222-Alexandrium_andersonii.AAC.1